MIYNYCVREGCDWVAEWEGGSVGDDPALPHLYVNTEHTVRGGVNDEHERLYRAQKRGKKDVTREIAES